MLLQQFSEARQALFDDYARFHAIEIQNQDVDPVYPVLRQIAEDLGWTPEERVRAVFLHVAYYDLGSCLAALNRRSGAFLAAFTQPIPGLRCGTERRRHRMGDNLREHLSDLHHIAMNRDGLRRWLETGLTDDAPELNWQIVTDRLLEVNGNGRWAAFKTCEMLAEVCGMPLRAPDMGHANSSGPRQGLGLLYPEARSLAGNRLEVVAELNVMSEMLVRELRERGLDARLETAETTLCDFRSLCEGRYYAGLDIDVMHEQIANAPLSPEMRHRAYLAREAVLPHAYLGEWEDAWHGPDRVRKRIYRSTGEIVTR